MGKNILLWVIVLAVMLTVVNNFGPAETDKTLAYSDFVDLVELIRARKERKEADDLEEYAANAPDIHLIVVVPVCQQALGGAIPPRRDVFCVRLFAVDAAAGAEVRELEHVLCDQNVLLRSAVAQS